MHIDLLWRCPYEDEPENLRTEPLDLGNETDDSESKSDEFESPKTWQPQRCPSWSWISVDPEVRWNIVYRPSNINPDAQFRFVGYEEPVSLSMTPETEDGPILSLSGKILEVRVSDSIRDHAPGTKRLIISIFIWRKLTFHWWAMLARSRLFCRRCNIHLSRRETLFLALCDLVSTPKRNQCHKGPISQAYRNWRYGSFQN